MKSLFRNSREQCWRRLAAEIEGDFVEGTWLRSSAVQAHTEDWIVTLDLVQTDKTVFTRLRAPFVNPDVPLGTNKLGY